MNNLLLSTLKMVATMMLTAACISYGQGFSQDFESFELGEEFTAAAGSNYWKNTHTGSTIPATSGVSTIGSTPSSPVNSTQYLVTQPAGGEGVASGELNVLTTFDSLSGIVIGQVDFFAASRSGHLSFTSQSSIESNPGPSSSPIGDGVYVQFRQTNNEIRFEYGAGGASNRFVVGNFVYNSWYRVIATMYVDAENGSNSTFDLEVIDLVTGLRVGEKAIGYDMLGSPTDIGGTYVGSIFNDAAEFHWDNWSVAPVPEPGAFALLGGIAVLSVLGLKRVRLQIKQDG